MSTLYDAVKRIATALNVSHHELVPHHRFMVIPLSHTRVMSIAVSLGAEKFLVDFLLWDGTMCRHVELDHDFDIDYLMSQA